MHLRNKLYDKGFLHAHTFDIPIIAVGNLSVGGTGKTPMVDWLLKNFSNQHRIATLSRGYGRTSKGFRWVTLTSSASETGDEPLLLKYKNPQANVAVCERRAEGIKQILHEHPATSLILLDDAFQHRAVKPGFQILLTDYNNPYYTDRVLPEGKLRESKTGANRAQVIIVTKCPPSLSEEQRTDILHKIKPTPKQEVYFSGIGYGSVKHESGPQISSEANAPIIAISGIANAKPFIQNLEQKGTLLHHFNFNDHHLFTINDLQQVAKRYEKLKATYNNLRIVTTEKDWMRLQPIIQQLQLTHLPIYSLPIEPYFYEQQGSQLRNLLQHYLNQYPRNR